MIAFDTETRGFDWWNPEQQAFLAQWAGPAGAYSTTPGDNAGSARFLAALTSADGVVAHNLPFDVHMVRATWGWDLLGGSAPLELHDTALMSRIYHSERSSGERATGGGGGHGLKNLARDLLGAPDWEAKRDERALANGIPNVNVPNGYYLLYLREPDALVEYAVADAFWTRELYNYLQREPQDSRLVNLYGLERKVQRILIGAEQRGVRVDPEAVERLRVEYTRQNHYVADRLEDTLGFVPEGAGSEDMLREALLMQGIPLTAKTPKDQDLSTARWALEPFVEEYPVIAHLFEYRRTAKFLSTYINPMVGREVVHGTINQAEAWTGRMAMRRPNMQNLPKRRDTAADENMKIRSMFVPREGHAFVVSDYEGIEDKLLAYYLGVPWYRDLVREQDSHAYTASEVWGGKPAAYFKGTAGEAKRNLAKHGRYALVYGAGAPKFTSTINGMVPKDERITIEQARSMVKRIKRSMPGYYDLMREIREQIESEGYVRTLMGRKNHVNPDKAYVGLNALIQGSAADIMKQGLVSTMDAFATHCPDAQPLLVVHDELVTEVPIEEAEHVAATQTLAMAGAADVDPPLTVETSITKESYAHA